MNIVFAISTTCALFFSILFAFPKVFMAKFNYKNISHPDDYEFSDTVFYRIVSGVLMVLSWTVCFYAISMLG